MGITLTDFLLFGKAIEANAGDLSFRIMRNNVLRWGALAGYIEVVVRGTSPLSLPDALDDKLLDLKAYGDCENRNLPEGYQELEYIEGMANVQYINTGIVPNSSMEIYIKAQNVETVTSSSYTPCGARNATYDGFDIFNGAQNCNVDWFGSSVSDRWAIINTDGSVAANTIIEFSCKNNLAEVLLNGASKGTHQFTPASTVTTTIWLNGINNNGSPATQNMYNGRIYRFTIKNICDMIPAKRLSDNEIGMWDKIRKQFFTNAGTGDFTAGANITDPTPTAPQDIWCNNGAIKAIRPIKYLESTGTQYIDTGFIPSGHNIKIKTKLEVIGATNSNVFFGEFKANEQLRSHPFNGNYFFGYATGSNNTIAGNPTVAVKSGDVIEYDWTNNTVKFNCNGTDYNYTLPGTVITSDLSIWLFSLNTGNGQNDYTTSAKMYYFQVYDNDVLVRDMIPALDAQNIPCMFDKVEGKCYYNAGTGQFIAGYLPAEYEELEYIQSSGSEYINTGITVNQNTEIETEFQRTDLSVAGYMYGVSRSGNTGVCTAYFNTTSSVAWRFSSDTVNPVDNGFLDTNWHHTIQNKNGVTADGVLKAYTSIADFTTGVQLPLFRGYNASTSSYANGAAVRIKRFQIRQSGASVADMIPARKRSNGHIGMYDLVRRQFFENAGEGQFTIGKLPILPDGYTRLEYLESTGTQYIDTGVKPNQDTSVELDGSLDGYGIIFGVRTAALVDISTIQGTSTGYWAMGYNTSADPIGTKDSNRHVWFKNKNLQYMDGELKNNYTYANFTAMGNAYLFAYNNNGTVGYVINGRVRVYSCKIWATADSMLVRYMIPAKRNSDGVVGMYDIMNDVFLTNQGTGNFEYGSEIPDSRESYYYVDGVVEKVGTRSAGNKNLFNGVFEQGGLYQGNLVVADTRIRTPDYLTFPAGTYTISCASAYEVWIEKNNASSVNWYSSYTFTAASTDKFKVAVRSKTDPSTTVIRPDDPVKVQIEAGSTATAYVPYCDGGLAVCENLLGIDSIQDIQEILTGEVTRKVGVFVLTGEEWWEKLNFADKSVFRTKVVIPDDRYSNPENNVGLCSHFTVIPTSVSVTSLMNNLELAWNTNSLMCIRYDSMANLTDFLAFLRSQYDAGTPVTIVYPLATASTESVAGQTLTVSAGNNTAEIIQASIDGLELEVKYTKNA